MRMSTATGGQGQRDTFTGPLCEWEPVCTQAVLLGVIPGALSLEGRRACLLLYNLSPWEISRVFWGGPQGGGHWSPLVPLLKPWGVLAGYK